MCIIRCVNSDSSISNMKYGENINLCRKGINKIEFIVCGHDYRCEDILSIDLSWNYLYHMKKDNINWPKSLKHVNLTGNYITELDVSYLAYSDVTSINLSRNRITDISTYKWPESIKSLDLSYNFIELFRNIPNHCEIFLSNNNIKKILQHIPITNKIHGVDLLKDYTSEDISCFTNLSGFKFMGKVLSKYNLGKNIPIILSFLFIRA